MEAAELCFPQLLNLSCRAVPRPRTQATLLYALLFSVTALTVFLNLLVVISIGHFRQLHTPTNLILLSLAVSDFLVGLLVMPVATVRVTERCWRLGDNMCPASVMINFILISSSVGSMVMISVDRYVAICNPMQYSNRITYSRVQVWVCVSWAICFLYNGVILRDSLRRPGKLRSCFGECVIVIDYISATVDFVVNVAAPCSVIVVLYTRVFVVAVSQARALRSHATVVTAKRSEFKAAKTLGVVIVVFIATFCPYYFPSVIGQDITNTAPEWPVVSWLMYLSSCLNPLIYALFYPWFRKSMKIIVTLKVLTPDSSSMSVL